MTDPIQILRTFMLAQAGITAQVVTRIWGEVTPPNEVSAMPRKAIRLVVSMEGPESPLIPALVGRATIICYGASQLEAWEVAGAVYDALRRGGMTAVPGVANLYRLDCEQAGSFMYEPQSDWPRVTQMWSFVMEE